MSSKKDVFQGNPPKCVFVVEKKVVDPVANQTVRFRYLNDFSKALAGEVRILLAEVGKLRDERRQLQ